MIISTSSYSTFMKILSYMGSMHACTQKRVSRMINFVQDRAPYMEASKRFKGQVEKQVGR